MIPFSTQVPLFVCWEVKNRKSIPSATRIKPAFHDNLTFVYSREVPMEEIIEAARAASLHEFITALPAGYDTRLGASSSTQVRPHSHVCVGSLACIGYILLEGE